MVLESTYFKIQNSSMPHTMSIFYKRRISFSSMFSKTLIDIPLKVGLSIMAKLSTLAYKSYIIFKSPFFHPIRDLEMQELHVLGWGNYKVCFPSFERDWKTPTEIRLKKSRTHPQFCFLCIVGLTILRNGTCIHFFCLNACDALCHSCQT
nr:hypothetical protein Itr_chr14CG25260 [Ipomoea trifida]